MKTRLLIILAAVLLTLVLAAVLGQRAAVQRLRAGIEAALGPRASVGTIAVGWSGIEIRDLRIRAERGRWPAEDELRAERVRLRPDLASLWSAGWRISEIEVDAPYVSLLRSREGRLRLLPALLERTTAARQGPGSRADAPAAVRIAHIALRDAAIDFFDASVRQPAHRMRLDQLDASVGPLAWPGLDEPAHIDLRSRFKGPQHDGRLAIAGQLTPASRDAALKASVRGVDLVALQPYLLKVDEAGVRRGTLDLSLEANVKAQRLHAPGRVTLTGLELAGGSGVLSTFAGVPRQAVMAAMARDGRIEFAFTLDGRLDDPNFSLNADFATRLAGGLAETLGVSLGGVVEGVGSVIKGLLGR
jgi:hypothetical protein